MPTSPSMRWPGVRSCPARIVWLFVAWTIWLSCAAARAHAPAEQALAALQTAIDEARFQEAERQARALLLRSDLRAHERNRGLELLAVTQIAARQDVAAQATLAELYARDPDHPTRLGDQGPRVAAAHARAQAHARTTPRVVLGSVLGRDARGRPLLEVQLGAGRDAIDSVHVFSHAIDEENVTHLVAAVGTLERLTVPLPAPPAGAVELAIYLEARAPSGAVIGRQASREAPLRGVLPAYEVRCEKPPEVPVRRAWWLWTSIALVAVAGIGVGGALAAH